MLENWLFTRKYMVVPSETKLIWQHSSNAPIGVNVLATGSMRPKSCPASLSRQKPEEFALVHGKRVQPVVAAGEGAEHIGGAIVEV